MSSNFSPSKSIESPVIPPKLGMVIAVIAVSTGSIIIRKVQTEVGALVISFFRLAISTLIMLPMVLHRRKEIVQLSFQQWLLLLIGGGCLALHFASWISSLKFTSVLSSVVFVNTSPLWVALLAPLVLKERITRGVKLGLCLALAGTLIVAGGGIITKDGHSLWQGNHTRDAMQVWTGNGLALAGAWFASGFLLVGRKLRPVMSLSLYTFILYGIAALVMLGILTAFGELVERYSIDIYLWLTALALVPQLMGHSMFNWALRYVSAAYVAVVLLGEPVGASILAYLFLGETPGIFEILGAIVILIGIYVATAFEKAEKKNPLQD